MHSTAGDSNSQSGHVPAASLLNRWSEWDWNNGLQINHLRDLQTLQVRTKNTLYELTVISASEGMVLVRGGNFFPELTPVHLNGSTAGGSFIKNKGIYVGFCIEFGLGERRIITTSPVDWIGPVQDPGDITH